MALSKIGTDGIDTAATPTVASATVTGDLTVDTNTLYVDSTNNRVGIGVTPERQLHIEGNGAEFSLVDTQRTSGSRTANMFIDASDRTNLRMMNDAMTAAQVAIRFDASGRVTMPAQPAFSAYGNNGWNTFSNGSDTLITFPNTAYNIGNNFDTSTGVFTAPVNGVYAFTLHVYGRVQSGAGTGTYWGAWMKQNGNNISGNLGMTVTGYTYASGGTDEISSDTTLVQLSANDAIQCYARTFNSSYNGEWYGTFTELKGYLVG